MKEVSALKNRIDSTAVGMKNRIDSTDVGMKDRIDSAAVGVNYRIDSTSAEMKDRIDSTAVGMKYRIDSISAEMKEISALKCWNVAFGVALVETRAKMKLKADLVDYLLVGLYLVKLTDYCNNVC